MSCGSEAAKEEGCLFMNNGAKVRLLDLNFDFLALSRLDLYLEATVFVLDLNLVASKLKFMLALETSDVNLVESRPLRKRCSTQLKVIVVFALGERSSTFLEILIIVILTTDKRRGALLEIFIFVIVTLGKRGCAGFQVIVVVVVFALGEWSGSFLEVLIFLPTCERRGTLLEIFILVVFALGEGSGAFLEVFIFVVCTLGKGSTTFLKVFVLLPSGKGRGTFLKIFVFLAANEGGGALF
ncbi:MAG: hypothetical protein INR71_08745 [Terriglobus roseus]|nr:hypothetical protein [Terriglobus roseus]